MSSTTLKPYPAFGQIWSWVHADSKEDMILLTRFDRVGLLYGVVLYSYYNDGLVGKELCLGDKTQLIFSQWRFIE